MKQVCTIKNCNNPVKSRGWCRLHYLRWYRNGDPLKTIHEMHGMGSNKRRTQEYTVWNGMKARCYNQNSPKYYAYGGRGITVCDRWLKSFQNFFDDMGTKPTPKHTIERIDVNGNYEPSNCIWATYKVQGNNTRRNRLITFNNETHTLKQWSEITGLKTSAIETRLRKGFSVEEALTFSLYRRR